MRRAAAAIAIPLLAAAALALGSALRPAAAGPPEPSASAVAAPSATASAEAKPAAPRKPRRFLAGFPDGAPPSPQPTPEEWKAAEPLELSRSLASCNASRVREYVRITCLQADVFAARVAVGSEEGVYVLDPKWEPRRPRDKGGIDVVVPVRRGDKRLVVLALSIPVWKSPTPDEGVHAAISESWLPGEPGPTIVIH